MPSTTRIVGILLMIIGLAGYWLTGRTSVTALIPAFFGIVFVALAYISRSEATRRHAMHAAVAIALLGLLGTLGRAIPAILAGQIGRPAVIAQVLTGLLLAWYVYMGVQSFIAARRARRS
jgi:hypothetical protein